MGEIRDRKGDRQRDRQKVPFVVFAVSFLTNAGRRQRPYELVRRRKKMRKWRSERRRRKRRRKKKRRL